jgi:hypothetical protein
MTIRDLITAADREPWLVAAALLLAPLAAFVWGALHKPGQGATPPWRYGYSVWIYLASIPGMFAAVLLAYALFFTRENLLDANLIVYVLPIVAMVATLAIVRRKVEFDAVPGFDRISGLLILLGLSFAAALAIQKTNIWLFFGASIEKLLLIALALFALGRWAAHLVFRRKGA